MRAGQISVQQGGPDGLCGIYMLLNFLEANRVAIKAKSYWEVDENEKYSTEDKDNKERIFCELMHSAEETGNLCAETICNGFAPQRLKSIYENMLWKNKLSGECHIEEDDEISKNIFDISGKYFNKQSSIGKGIGVLLANQSHWVLIARANEHGLLIYDSSDENRSYILTRQEDARRARKKCNLDPGTLMLLSVKSRKR